jgi:hypothetical protein
VNATWFGRRSAGRALASIVAAVLLAGAGLTFAPAPDAMAAADKLVTTGTSTYELDPDEGVIRVTVAITLTNRAKSTTRSWACTQYAYGYAYQTTCTQRTDYYFNEYRLWTERDASRIRITADKGKVTRNAGKRDGEFQWHTVKFSSILYGQTRKLKVTYDLPAGAPRSESYTRASKAYASFCALGNGEDSGTVTVRIPAGYEITTGGEPMTTRRDGDWLIYETGKLSRPWEFWACFQGTNPDGYLREVVTSGGRTVTIEAWPEDEEWLSAVRSGLTTWLTAVTALVGHPEIDASTELTIREIAQDQDYGGFHDAASNTILVGEDYAQPGLLAHEFAHVWFNRDLFSESWLSEGHAGWAEREVGANGERCVPAGTYPGTGSPKLYMWLWANAKSSDSERAVVGYQYDASCHLVSSVAQAIGKERMRDVLAALLAGRSPYTGDGIEMARGDRGVNWQEWLDAVDELGIVPAGADDQLAPALLAKYGISRDEALIASRTEARSAYHALRDTVEGWTVPVAIRQPLDDWQFSDAQAAIVIADEVWATTGRVEATLDQVDARNGAVAEQFKAAAAMADLEAALALAEEQLALAVDVADALALLAAPRDTLQELGLAGETLPTPDAALAAVTAIDGARATAEAAAMRELINGARDAGILRAAIATALVLVLLLSIVLAVVMRRRGRRRRLELRLAMDTAGPPLPVEALEVPAEEPGAG